MATGPEILLIEPFYGGSHKQLMDVLAAEVEHSELITMTAKKWHWRARTSSLYLSQVIPRRDSYKVLFASSVLNLAELISLRPDLANLKKVLYFHENQLVYPVRKQQERDFQYGYNQVLSCLVADIVVFNSKFNQDSFLDNIASFMKLIPDYRPKNLKDIIQPKCRVINFPLKLPQRTSQLEELDMKLCCAEVPGSNYCESGQERVEGSMMDVNLPRRIDISRHEPGGPDIQFGHHESLDEADVDEQIDKIENTAREFKEEKLKPLHIVWPHRWEHDKGPGVFFEVLYKLVEEGLNFKVSILGETYLEIPDVFLEAKEKLTGHILHWGFVNSKEDYYNVLRSADVVVSTAGHEFFGVAMLESVHLGCYPLCPNRLVYPEIFPREYLYNTDQQLYKRIRNFCQRPQSCRTAKINVDVEKYSWQILQPYFKEVLSWET